MSKTANKPRRAENEAIAKAWYIKGSERKLNLLAQLIRGKAVARALIDLEFSHKRMSVDVKKVLEAAIANAENNHNLDVDRLVVKEAYVGRTMTLKRFMARGRGKSAGIEKPFANITVVVAEKAVAVATEEKKVQKKTAKKGSATGTAKKAAQPKAKAGE
jgi:large subunit ribosomal protein L22